MILVRVEVRFWVRLQVGFEYASSGSWPPKESCPLIPFSLPKHDKGGGGGGVAPPPDPSPGRGRTWFGGGGGVDPKIGEKLKAPMTPVLVSLLFFNFMKEMEGENQSDPLVVRSARPKTRGTILPVGQQWYASSPRSQHASGAHLNHSIFIPNFMCSNSFGRFTAICLLPFTPKFRCGSNIAPHRRCGPSLPLVPALLFPLSHSRRHFHTDTVSMG